MSHSFTGPSGNVYFHNGDFSGSISVAGTETHGHPNIEIPFEDLKALYRESLRVQAIDKAEEEEFMTEQELAALRARVNQLEETLIFIAALLNLHHPELIRRAAQVSADTIRHARHMQGGSDFDGHRSQDRG